MKNEGLRVSEEAREYIRKVEEKYIARHGRVIWNFDIYVGRLEGSVCRVKKADYEILVLDCGDYEISIVPVIGSGDVELEAYVSGGRGKPYVCTCSMGDHRELVYVNASSMMEAYDEARMEFCMNPLDDECECTCREDDEQ